MVSAKQRAARALFARRARAGFFRRGRSLGTKLRHVRRRSSGGGGLTARRRVRHHMSRFRGRFRRGHRSKQGLASKAVNGLGLLIGFNREIGAAWTQVQLGRFDQVAPEVAASFGIERDGSFNQAAFISNVTSKVGAIAFVKLAHYLLKHARLKI